ncbi:hypothetical protein D3OALGA1CA_5203 [Olavius algarvensis associated proteobacterium Delta 3]|nr:hypothetical protein D3OALGA1CA_5203 [Olavius algarvensis associated proteobacterium Delta 3]
MAHILLCAPNEISLKGPASDKFNLTRGSRFFGIASPARII